MRQALIDARGSKTQLEVSCSMGISQKYLSKLELGQRNPSLKMAVKISNYYNKNLETLFPDMFSIGMSTVGSN